MNASQILTKPSYSLLAIIAALTTIHLTILFESSVDPNIVSLHCLLLVGIASLFWEERKNFVLNSDPLSTLIGTLLIGLVLIRTVSPSGYHLAMSPLIMGLGVCLLASNIKSLNQYTKGLILLSLPALYPLVTSLLKAGGITLWTARFSGFLLWASGFAARRENFTIILPRGRVEVLGACAGIDGMLLMLTISVLFFMLVPLNLIQKVTALLVAFMTTFLLNCFRVGILALLADGNQLDSFHFWHGGSGSLVFSVISVGIFGGFCWLAYIRTILEEEPTVQEDAGDIN